MNLNKLTLKAQESLQAAQQKAYENKHPQVENEHLFSGILEVDENVLPFVFDRLKVDLSRVKSLNEYLFIHFFNEILLNLGSLLIITSKPPNEINFSLDDLESRIRSCISTKIELPDDDFLFSILVKELSDKKIFLNDKFCLYIIKRIKRNYKSISLFAETLDVISLEQKKKITLKQIKEVLNIIDTRT